mmetsp:Transcript_31374/g.66816  ORF Transcript_31374/g.66816 Transcript_31374/m.66816 type:complete len:119 (+) Transcript_31374:485-841(+)
MLRRAGHLTVLVEFDSDGYFGFREGPDVAGEELAARAEEAAVARDGPHGGGGGGHWPILGGPFLTVAGRNMVLVPGINNACVSNFRGVSLASPPSRPLSSKHAQKDKMGCSMLLVMVM